MTAADSQVAALYDERDVLRTRVQLLELRLRQTTELVKALVEGDAAAWERARLVRGDYDD